MNRDTKDPFAVSKDGKFGLALSGGGFRASLFHIGVLARLAELDLLRQLQVLSTVSGGSIIGAMYYLKLKQLLEHSRSDGLIPSSPNAYIILVKELETEFLKGVQTNLRMRALLNPIKNAKMLISDDYSRSDRMSELYHKTFYKPVWNSKQETFFDWLQDVLCIKDGRADIFLKDLKINPPNTEAGFDVREYNKTADYKIPILAINATILNSGEHWLFTASSVGVFSPYNEDIHPSHTLYPEIRFDDPKLTPKQKAKLNILTLSDAVAASACVPALFAPLAIHDLYPLTNGKEIVVELVDGGVFDNQGLTTLLDDEKCTHIICSDAAGQLQYIHAPESSASKVMMRSNELLMERIRSLTIAAHFNKTQDTDIRFWHLRDKFQGTPFFPSFSLPVEYSDEKTDGEIYLLSAIRTDLDAFNDIEAHALMYDGYCLCDRFTNQSAGLNSTPNGNWSFLNIIPTINQPPVDGQPKKLIHHLCVSSNLFFKAFLLMENKGKILGAILGIIILAILWTGIYQLLNLYKDTISAAISAPALIATAIIGSLVIGLLMSNLPRPVQKWVDRIADGIRAIRSGNFLGLIYPVAIIGAVGSVIAYFHLTMMNKKYLELGRIDSKKHN